MASNKDILEALSAPFPENLIRTRVGAGGAQLRWVPARSVSERLDQVLGVTGWDFEVTTLPDKAVHGSLTIKLPDGSSSTRSDFGYETGGSGESLKEAASDALRRCASLFGVARYLYQGEALPARGVPAPARRPADDGMDIDIARAAMKFAKLAGGGECPVHNKAWVLKPGGVSKTTGREYAAFYSCGVKDGNGWCKSKPAPAWIAEQRLQPAESKGGELANVLDQAKPAPTSELDEIPF